MNLTLTSSLVIRALNVLKIEPLPTKQPLYLNLGSHRNLPGTQAEDPNTKENYPYLSPKEREGSNFCNYLLIRMAKGSVTGSLGIQLCLHPSEWVHAVFIRPHSLPENTACLVRGS